MTVLETVLERLKSGPLHFVLIDPDPMKQSIGELDQRLDNLKNMEIDVIMVGGSSGFSTEMLDKTIQLIKQKIDIPVILFPGNVSGVSKYADAIFFMSLLNSRNPYWITGAQAMGSILVKRSGIEPISMAYIIIEPGGTVSFVGDAKPIPRDKPEIAAAYALAGQYFGMQLVYLEAGSGAEAPIPAEIVGMVKKLISVPLIVGGGMRKPEDVLEKLEAGADIIVTGTIAENDPDGSRLKAINDVIKNFRR